MIQSSIIDQPTINAYLETHYCVSGRTPFVLQIGLANDSLLQLYKRFRTNCAAFITACNPYSKEVNEMINADKQAELARELSKRNLTFFDAAGQHPTGTWHGEPSYLVLGLSLEAAKALGLKYCQNAIIWCDENAIPVLILLR